MANKPRIVDPIAEEVLDRLAGRCEAAEIVLGGYFALQHYADYRATHDIDAWWRTKSSPAAEAVIRAVMQEMAGKHKGELSERRFGETVSFELRERGRKRFSFQIAVRSVELEPPVPSAWPPIMLETLKDNVGAKMNALVERGAPRDFVDLRHVVTLGLSTPKECWTLWQRKNPGASVDSARSKVTFHLGALELRRPLAAIDDRQERAKAQETREWFRREFLGIGA